MFATSSPSFFEQAKRLGADAVFDYHDENVVAQVRKASDDAIGLALDCWSADGTVQRTIVSFMLLIAAAYFKLRMVDQFSLYLGLDLDKRRSRDSHRTSCREGQYSSG